MEEETKGCGGHPLLGMLAKITVHLVDVVKRDGRPPSKHGIPWIQRECLNY